MERKVRIMNVRSDALVLQCPKFPTAWLSRPIQSSWCTDLRSSDRTKREGADNGEDYGLHMERAEWGDTDVGVRIDSGGVLRGRRGQAGRTFSTHSP